VQGKLFTISAIFAAFFLTLNAAAQTLVPSPPQPADRAWPTAGWETGALPVQSAAPVKTLIDTAIAAERSDVMGETRAVVIIHNGRLVAEAYREGFGPGTKQISWSMAKSITSALAGRAVQLGVIDSIETPMPTPFAPNDPRADITWRQWLTMTDGLDYRELGATGLDDSDVVQMMFGRGHPDVLAYVKDELPPVHPPGTHWNYSTAGFHLIGNALQTEIGAGKDTAQMRDWMENSLFAPIGMDAQPEFDPAGTFLGGSLVWASARDFAKFGYLYLRGGVWDGAQILPPGWTDFARTNTPGKNANVYGAGFWITAYGAPLTHTQTAASPPWDAFHAGGHEGQTIWIVPSKDLVIVRLGLMENNDANWGALYEWNQKIARAFPDAGID
jgi:CubicO group peptidase (beta-lactamase class C family)